MHFCREYARIELWELRHAPQSPELVHEECGLWRQYVAPDGIWRVGEPGIPRVEPAVAVPVTQHVRHLPAEITGRIPIVHGRGRP